VVQSSEAADAAICDGNPEAVLPEPDADGLADVGIVVDNEDTAHGSPVELRPCRLERRASVAMVLFNGESAAISYFRRKHGGLSALHRVLEPGAIRWLC
jgi:hypothetical protein